MCHHEALEADADDVFEFVLRPQAAAKALTEMDCIPAPASSSASFKSIASDGRPQWHSAAQAQAAARPPGGTPAPDQRRVPRRRWAPLGPVDANAEPWRAGPAAKPNPAARHGDAGAAGAAGLRARGEPRLQEQVPPVEAGDRGDWQRAHGPGRGLQGSRARQALSDGERRPLDFGVQARR